MADARSHVELRAAIARVADELRPSIAKVAADVAKVAADVACLRGRQDERDRQ